MIRALQSVLFAALLSLVFTGCYRAPYEGEFCTIPATNNPSITRHAGSFQPGVGY